MAYKVGFDGFAWCFYLSTSDRRHNRRIDSRIPYSRKGKNDKGRRVN